MRAFLISLAIAVTVLVASPVFWSLVRMSWAAEPVTYVEHDGTVQTATLGPQSYWPDWALRPDGAKINVESHFDAAGSRPAIGVAAVQFTGDQQPVVAQYEADLAARGFAVMRYAMETSTPDLPPRRITYCVVEGVHEAPVRVIRLSFSVNSDAMPAKLFWMDGPAVAMIGMAPSNCF
jgi:hypothetical protein